jgi:hypothetical protein
MNGTTYDPVVVYVGSFSSILSNTLRTSGSSILVFATLIQEGDAAGGADHVTCNQVAEAKWPTEERRS